MRILCLLAPALAALALAACGGGEDPAPASSNGTSNRPVLDEKTKQAMLAFARCMRQHGVDMPDPKFDGGGAVIRSGSRNMTPEQVKAAEQACAKYQKQIKPPAIPKEQQEKFKQQALANARCMREHGIDMPDPQFGPNGEVKQRIGGRIEPTDQKFQAAQKACNKGGGLFGGQAAP
jgi:hypothetical protein